VKKFVFVIWNLVDVIGSRVVGDTEQANKIEEPLIDFVVSVIKVADSLPKSPTGQHFANQLLRAGTSPALNYAEARGAESNADFVHQLRIALKEPKESCVWLRMACRVGLMKSQRLDDRIEKNNNCAGSRMRPLKTRLKSDGISSRSLSLKSDPRISNDYH
jgi:four helix bundle protein